jgi:hypothetical protein
MHTQDQRSEDHRKTQEIEEEKRKRGLHEKRQRHEDTEETKRIEKEKEKK